MKVLVIGAGVGGLFFASFMEGYSLKIIEKNEFAGRKLLATGNGRCNFTNLNLSTDNYKSFSKDFVSYAIKNFTNQDLIRYFNEIGVLTTNLPSGRCYPLTMSAKTIRDSLFLKAKENASFIFNEEVKAVDLKKKQVKTTKKTYDYDYLVIATGGISLRNSGSDGKIFKLLKNDIPLTDLSYSITNYETREKLSKKAKGTKVSARASLYIDGKFMKSSIDDIIFQDYGLTGTAILDISNDLSLGLMKNKTCQIRIDFFPDLSNEDFKAYIKNLISKFDKRSIKDILIGIINEKLIDDILKISKIKPHTLARKISKSDLENLINNLKELTFNVSQIHDKENAQVTIGGFDSNFINPKTMESLKAKDVFIIGESLDVAGDCGGYNIQWAASSAYLCAQYLRSLDV